MAQYQFAATLDDVRGFLRSIKPNADPILLRTIINSELRAVLDRYPVWSGLLRKKTVHIRPAVTIEQVALTYGSNLASISGATAPVSDGGAAMLAENVQAGLLRWVALSSPMHLIPGDTVVISASGVAEAVPVYGVDGNSIRIRTQRSFPSGASVTRSSWAGRQIRLGDTKTLPTIMGVVDASTLILNSVWDAPSISVPGLVMDAYIRIAYDLKQVVGMVDVSTRNRLNLYVSQEQLSKMDPARLASGPPVIMSPAMVDAAGNLLYEIYPHQTDQRTLLCDYIIQWPDLEDGADMLPPFMNPNIIMWRAASQALRLRVSASDEYYDPASAMFYEQRAAQALEEAIKADQGRAEMLISSGLRPVITTGASWQEVPVGAADLTIWR